MSAAAIASTLVWTHATQDAVANGDTRTITLYHTHSKESATVTFRRNGQYDSDGLKQLNRFLRDWRNDDQTKMDPRLFDVVWAAYRESGSSEPINIVSAYRSPGTNAMLRRRSRAVAENSQHIAGKAMDFFLTDVGMDKVRAIGMRLQQGGVGFYPTSYNPFVHLDVGSVRSWPRMTHDQLARLFPDGRTVHLPADGKPLAGYELARADILARGGAVAGLTSLAETEDGNGGRRRSLWAALFGGDEDAEIARAPAPERTRLAARNASAVSGGGGNSEDGGTRGTPVAMAAAETAPRRDVPRPVAPIAAAPPADAPAPWSRLVAGLSSGSGTGADEKAAAADKNLALAFAPVPPARPIETPLLVLDLPMPPARPLASGGPDPARPGSTDAEASSEAAMPDRLAFIPHSLPPIRPGRAAPMPAPMPEALESGDEGGALRAMFSARAAEKTPRRGARIVTARAIPTAALETEPVAAAPGPRLRMIFSQNAAELDPSRFSGPAVAPLPLLR